MCVAPLSTPTETENKGTAVNHVCFFLSFSRSTEKTPIYSTRRASTIISKCTRLFSLFLYKTVFLPNAASLFLPFLSVETMFCMCVYFGEDLLHFQVDTRILSLADFII